MIANIDVTPIRLAEEHQKEIARLRGKIADNVGCIRQLLVGRRVRRKGQLATWYQVSEIRFGLTGVALVRGRQNNEGRVKVIGTVAELEMAP